MSQTPMMKQYNAAKEKHQDSILFFRMGDFYEVFYEDAELCSRALGIALTARNKGENAVPMAGVPVKSLDTYLTKLIQQGYRVAICEQIQEASEAQGIVERDVVRVITPGTITEEAVLNEKSHNFLLAIAPLKKTIGLAWVDISTGTFEVHEIASCFLADELARIAPAECLVPEKKRDTVVRVWESDLTISEIVKHQKSAITYRPDWFFAKSNAKRTLEEHLQVSSLEGFGCQNMNAGLGAAGALFHYVKETQKSTLPHITKIVSYNAQEKMLLDSATRNCLEITRSLRSSNKNTLLAVIDETQTAMGGRLLSNWLTSPLIVLEKIRARQQGVLEFIQHNEQHQNICKILASIQDIERLCARIASKRADARDLLALKNSLLVLPSLRDELQPFTSLIIKEIIKNLFSLETLATLLTSAIHEQPKPTLKDGDIIRNGYNEELDKLRKVQSSGDKWLEDFQKREAENTGIPSLKVSFNKVFNYYIEVTHTHSHRVPEHYVRKQTLKNAERYITAELKEYESDVLSANDRSKDLEYKLFQEIREEVQKYLNDLRSVAEAIACIDVLCSMAKTAKSRNYTCPELMNNHTLEIKEGRHPVLETTLDTPFIANELSMEPGNEIMIITGPNMAGKSTYIRQNALIILLAQIGSFVPAKKAKIGIVDRIFTRIGSADEIARGRSTFMVEMIETANILNNASAASFIVLDEVGRGTSTFDGVSLAWSIIEHIQKKINARTLFATHYHEMSDLADIYPNVRNYNVAIQEWNGQVAFLHKILEGSADRSYGIEVAKLAGIPQQVIHNSRKILMRLERHAIDVRNFTGQACRNQSSNNLFSMVGEDLIDTLSNLNVETLTPIDALNILKELQIEAQNL
ncbi:DNA mismatch repair protein MutS [Candidatus Uabimicrobium sp. HlEnr_7]|uniref:DNA mismatch repair protein MutS n=1 Tax=Candidatus Uabimicrobium helgolandensis TaxID=3095367 RepID=UPI003555D532